ncbi:sugar ABC transporter permease [Microbacterium chocolatum]|uniref:carbohydrate ABC transporter permease n=1 Tax=Microbacterium aurantiacum TaxID=162393 RepID=UPI00338DCC23
MATAISPFGTQRASRWMPWVGFTPALVLFALFGLVPAIGVVVLSFTNISGIPGVPWEWVGLDNYRFFFTGPQAQENWAILGRTAIFSASIVVIQNAAALGLAILFTQKLRGVTLMRSIVFMPTVLGVTVIGLIWLLFFNPTGGPAAAVWELFGQQSAFLGDPHLAFPLVIMIQIWSGLGYGMIIFIAALQAVPSDLHEAARVDGANAWQRFRNVTVPMIAPGITANVLISIIGTLQTFQLIFVLTGDNPYTSVLALKIFTIGFTANATGSAIQQQGLASAISIIQFVMVGIIALTTLWYLRRRETQL